MVKQTVCPNCGGSLRSESHGWICNKCKGFISLQDGKFYEYVEKPFLPPMTNADRIRAMTDEELAELLYMVLSEREKMIAEELSAKGIECTLVEFPALSIAAHLEYLQQPAEEDV